MLTKERKLFFLIIVLSLIAYLKSGGDSFVGADGSIIRPNYSQGDESVYVTAKIEDVGEEDIFVSLKEKELTADEYEEVYNSFYPDLVMLFLNGNESFENIHKDLCFPDEVEGYPFELEWTCNDRDVFDEDGRLNAETNGKTEILCSIYYEDFVREIVFEVTYVPRDEPDSETIFKNLADNIDELEQTTRKEDTVYLPSSIGGHSVIYTDKESKRKPIILLIGLVAALSIIYASKIDKEKEIKKRKEKIQQEYVVVIQKMVMYMSSGLSLRNIWKKIYNDKSGNNPIYDEINILINEMGNGIPEERAYINFSERIGLASVTRMTTLLSQNLRKGSTNLTILLQDEAAKAFEDRKRRARIKGEEAGTKLLAPMMILMAIVMMIIMVPAFFNI